MPYVFRAAAIFAFALLLSTAARADLVIQGVENAPDIAQGESVPDDHEFDLPEDARINLLQTPGGQTFIMHGPFEGTLAKFVSDCNGWLAFTRAYCKSDGGDELPVGGTRGF
jgi:hypothetical protein